MFELSNPVRHYAWGSTKAIPRLLGKEPDGRPHAEMWIGAHRSNPSNLAGLSSATDGHAAEENETVEDSKSLLDLVTSHPEKTLGTGVLERYGPRLPYLVKFLAPDKPLSLQVHPNKEQAESGFEREENSVNPSGNYADPNHKPEVLIALEPTRAFIGFRDPREIAQDLDTLECSGANKVKSALKQQMDAAGSAEAVKAAFAAANELSPCEVEDLISEIHSLTEQGSAPPSIVQASRVAKFHQDKGVAASLLFNVVDVPVGHAVFVGPGEVHAYIEGFGLEIMASSDNVLRAGLTQKKVDWEEFSKVASFEPSPAHLLTPNTREHPGHTRTRYDAPTCDFVVETFDFHFSTPQDLGIDAGPRVIVCLEGEVEVATAEDSLTLQQGGSVFVPDVEGAVAVGGRGRVAVVTVGGLV